MGRYMDRDNQWGYGTAAFPPSLTLPLQGGGNGSPPKFAGYVFTSPWRQGYRMWAMMELRNALSHPARLILRRMEAFSGCARRMLRANLRKIAIFSGP